MDRKAFRNLILSFALIILFVTAKYTKWTANDMYALELAKLLMLSLIFFTVDDIYKKMDSKIKKPIDDPIQDPITEFRSYEKEPFLQQDDAAPDSFRYFDMEFEKKVGLPVHEFKKMATHRMPDELTLTWELGVFLLEYSGDHPFYRVYKAI